MYTNDKDVNVNVKVNVIPELNRRERNCFEWSANPDDRPRTSKIDQIRPN